jgi:protein TonB
MLKRWIFLLAVLPFAALADGQPVITVTANPPPPLTKNPNPPPPPTTPLATGRPHNCLSHYPEAAMKAGIQGNTILDFVVTEKGAVADVRVTKSSGNADLDDAAASCVSQWVYKPATQDGKPFAEPWRATVQWAMH